MTCRSRKSGPTTHRTTPAAPSHADPEARREAELHSDAQPLRKREITRLERWKAQRPTGAGGRRNSATAACMTPAVKRR
ncbi:hypothetical protein KCP77_04055 [Salmonella enterica subsp. enterica]|nr:hypothetical protein KCP77_04055 [Salmonella enterica subsp. enterica]